MRPRALLLGTAGLGLAVAVSGISVAERPAPPRKHDLLKPQGKLALHVRTIDLGNAEALVRLDGYAKEPDPNFFVLHDDRDRHYIALESHCLPTDDGALECTLVLPERYLERGRILAVTVHLKGHEVEAPADEVRARFDEARERLTKETGDGGIAWITDAGLPRYRRYRDAGVHRPPDGGSGAEEDVE